VSPPTSTYTFKFYVNNGTTNTLVQVVPREVANTAKSTDAGTNPSALKMTSASGVHPLDATSVNVHVLGDPVLQGSTTVPFVVTGPDDLVMAAAAECGMVNDGGHYIGTSSALSQDPALQDLVTQEYNNNPVVGYSYLAPWSGGYGGNTYYFFLRSQNEFIVPLSCDELLAQEELLVCTADHLAQLADTIAPVTWNAVRFNTANVPSTNGVPAPDQAPPLSWVIPPPADNEKFIVRDLALGVLAHVPMLDAYYMPGGVLPAPGTVVGNQLAGTCSYLYGQLATMPATILSARSAFTDEMFGSGQLPGSTAVYPPPPATLTPATLAQERFTFEAQVLRNAGQLLHDLVRESVYSDLAGSAANAAGTADQIQGQVVGWGLNGNAPYNSLAHVARTLLGRLEMDPPNEVDPQCLGVPELNLLPSLADVGTQARVHDLGPLNGNQAVAATLFEHAGLVVADGATIDLGAALQAQLIGMRAASVGTDSFTYAGEPGGKAIAQLVAGLGAADLARAASHNRTTFSLLTESLTSDASALASAATGAGLTPSTVANTALPSSAGLAIAGGLDRGLVITDATARSGPMMVGSECADPGGLSVAQMDEAVPAAPATAYSYSPGFPGASWRQDVFALGGAIRSRLVRLRQTADGNVQADGTSSAAAMSRAAAVAELGAWAGTGRVILSTDAGDGWALLGYNQPQTFYLDFLGINPSDFGVSAVTALPNTITLVAGGPATAECAAKIRSTGCNPAAVANATWAPSLTTSDALAGFDSTTGIFRSRFGMTGSQVRLTFPLASLPSSVGSTQVLTAGTTFYLVASQDPTKAPGIGMVLGALRLPVQTTTIDPGYVFRYGEAVLPLSPMRSELLYDAFGIGQWVGAAPPKAGDLPISSGPSFCIEGVPRDVFVPLDNDLTDSTDSYENSWLHYLSLAQTAATRADDLGTTLVDIGFQQTMNAESDAQQIQQIEGDPVNVSDLTVDLDGNISSGASNGALGAVLNQQLIDLVFFTQDPLSVDFA
jgi:hypothetical protein